ncbi:hypothetical protein [Methanobrevibacter woesei]|uniref:hypothetical protein n=1 Tax=Methanobrevibacter woesei TaxID=190976 RepID=UPI0039F52E2E
MFNCGTGNFLINGIIASPLLYPISSFVRIALKSFLQVVNLEFIVCSFVKTCERSGGV